MRHYYRLSVATAALVPALALAWPPFDAYGPGAGAMAPIDTIERATPYGPMGYWETMPPMDPLTQTSGLRIQQSATADAYLLDIHLSGVMPEQIKVQARGPWLRITQDNSAQASQEETLSDGRGWRRSFSYSSATASRTLRVPRDGDTSALQRQDTPDAIHIAIPRTKPLTGPR